MSDKLSVFVPFSKFDEASGEVWGTLAEEQPDRSGEIMDYARSKPYFEAWSKSQFEASGGKSLGNVREMHGKSAVGKLIQLDYDDVNKRVNIGAQLLDPLTIQKVRSGVLTGWSVGGEYVGKREPEEHPTLGKILRFVASPQEASVVDRPCAPGSVFSMVKADGTTEQVPLVGRPEPKQVWKCGADGCTHELKADALTCEKRDFSDKQRSKMADAGTAMPDGSFPIANKSDLKNAIQAFGRAKNKSAAKAHIKTRAKALGATDLLPDDWSKTVMPAAMQKCLYGIAQLASGIQSIGWVHDSEEYEAAQEGDGSAVPDKINAGISILFDALIAMVEEEAAEWNEEEGGEMAMAAVSASLEKINAKPERLRELLAKRAEQEEHEMKPEELQKVVGESQAALQKVFAEGIEKITKTITDNETASKERFMKLETDVKLIKDNTPEKSEIAKRETAPPKNKDTRDTDPPKGKEPETVLELTKAALRPENAFQIGG